MNQNLSNQLWLPGSSSDNILLCDTKTNTHRAHQREDKHQWTLTHLHTHAFHVQPDRDTLAEIPFPKMADRSSVGAPRRWPVRGNALYSSHFPSPQVIFSLFLWMFSPRHSYPALVPCFVHLYAWSDRQESEKRVRGAQDIQAGVKRKQLHWLKSVFFSR